MNRAERRKYNFTKEQGEVFEKALNEAEGNAKTSLMSKTINYSTSGIFAALAVTLHDKYGWGHVRVSRLLSLVEEQFESVISDHVKLDELKQIVKDELDINIM